MKPKFKLENEVEMAELLGAFIGDGWIESSGNAFYIAGDRTEDKDYYDIVLAPLISKHFKPLTPKEFHYWSVYGIRLCGREQIQKALSLGFQSGKKVYRAEIPSWVMNSNNTDVIRAVLRGFFDTDGCFTCEKNKSAGCTTWQKTHYYRPRIFLSSTSQKLIAQLSYLLCRLGIHHTFTTIPGGMRKERNYAPNFKIWLNRVKAVEQWFEIIGSNNPRQYSRFELWQKQGHSPPRTTLEERYRLLEACP